MCPVFSNQKTDRPGQHPALVGDRRRMDRVVGRDAVAGDHQQRGAVPRRRPATYISRTFPLAIRGRSARRRHVRRCYQRLGRPAAQSSRRSGELVEPRDDLARRSGCSGRSRRSRRGRGRRARSSAASSSRSGDALVPGALRELLDDAVGLVARASPRLDEREQHALGEQRAVGQLEVLAHALARRPSCPSTARSRGAAGSRAGSSSRAGSTRSTEECEMSRSCHSATSSSAAWRVAAQHAREAGDLLGLDRVALVRHRRGALLPGAERLLHLAHLGALQVADLGREPLQARRRRARSRSAARRGGRAATTCVETSSRCEPEPREHARLEVGARSPRTCRRRPTARRRPPARSARSQALPRCGGPRRRSRRASRRRWSARRARRACARRTACRRARARARTSAATSSSAPGEDRPRRAPRSCSASAVSSTSEEVRPKWIQRPAWPADARQHVDERGHVVVGHALALVDRLDGEGRLADRLELVARRARVAEQRRQLLAGGDLDPAPALHARLVGPQAAELGAGVAGDHSGAEDLAPRGRPRCARCPGRRRRRARPGGICTIERIASSPPAAVRRPDSGTPITGRSVCAATAPGSAAEMPAPAMITRSPRMRAFFAYSATRSGCAVRRHDADLVQDAPLFELVGGLLHRLHVALGAHHDADAAARPRRTPRAAPDTSSPATARAPARSRECRPDDPRRSADRLPALGPGGCAPRGSSRREHTHWRGRSAGGCAPAARRTEGRSAPRDAQVG